MKFIYNKFFKLLCKILLSLCLVTLLLGLVLTDSYNNQGQFYSTYTANDIATEQAEKLIFTAILPYLEEDMTKDEISALLEDTGYLDPNYHFILYIEDETYSDITDMKSVALVNTTYHDFSFDGWSDEYVEIYVKNYINRELIKNGGIYEASYIFNIFNNNFKLIAIMLFVIMLVTIILSAIILITAGYKEKNKLLASHFDKIYLEILILGWVFIPEMIAFLQGGITSYAKIFISFSSIFIIILFGIIIIESIVSRIRNKIFSKTSVIIKMIIVCKEIIKQILVNISSKILAAIIISGAIFMEIFLLFVCYPVIEFSILLWFFMKFIEFLLLMYFYSNICKLRNSAKEMKNGSIEVKINTKEMYGITKETAGYMNEIFNGFEKAIAEKLKSEQLKTELITNVSHDLKTPLTSIINYVDLMKKEDIDNPKLKEYLEVIDNQSMRLKRLTEDVVEASKAATGNIKVELTSINISEMMIQALGEYENKFNDKQLTVIFDYSTKQYNALADGRLLWRVIDNLFSNVCKYALEGTRFYIDIDENEKYVIISAKNISKYQLNISADELMQRFVRGDSSRSTSGNGLGLSIAESLMSLQDGELKLDINGDLFTTHIYLAK